MIPLSTPEYPVLGPILFLCHINDLPDSVTSSGSQFAYFAKRRTFLDFGLCEETNILGFWLVRREQHFRVLTFAKGPFCKSMLTLG
jgi:hypothetical protein